MFIASVYILLMFNLIDFETGLNSHVIYSEVTFYLLHVSYYSCPFALFFKKNSSPSSQLFFLSGRPFGFCTNRRRHLLKKDNIV